MRTMENFVFRAAGDITFGGGSAGKTGEILRRQGVGKVLVIVDPGFAKAGPFEKITDSLAKEKIPFVVFDGVEPEPPVELADQGGALARREKCDFVLGVGGGSAMDTAKAAAVLATNEGQARDYQGLDKVPKPGLRKGMIPTTAGTGSEVTFTAVFVNRDQKKKAGINSAFLYPELSILDPELTLNLPPTVTAFTGMDALAHAIESYTSTAANTVSEIFSLRAIRLIGRNLREAVFNGRNAEARANMLLGSLLAGVGLANAGVTAVHSLAYPMGGEFRVPHGVANGMLLGPVMEYNVFSCPEKFAKIAEEMGERTQGLGTKEGALSGVKAVQRLSREIEMPQRLSDLGIPEDALPRMAEEALKVARPLANNPRPVSKEDAIRIYQGVF